VFHKSRICLDKLTRYVCQVLRPEQVPVQILRYFPSMNGTDLINSVIYSFLDGPYLYLSSSICKKR
jgi:hypothetical protein